MKKTETFLAIIAILSVLGTLYLITGASILLMVSFTALFVIYLYFSFAIFNNIRLRHVFKKESYLFISRNRIIGAIGVGFALSIALIGILFKFQSWPGAYFLIYLGVISISLVATVAIIQYMKNKDRYYTAIFKRLIIIGVPLFVLSSLPKSALIDFKYRNYPAYLKALKNHNANPEDEHLLEILDDERQKMYEDQIK